MSYSHLHQDLDRLAKNLWWSWNPEAQSFWQAVAAKAGADPLLARNPARLVAGLNQANLERLEMDSALMVALRRVMRQFQAAQEKTSAFAPLSWKHPVAYFSMEFGVHESVPIYSGGLGILAGDHAKSAGEERVPLVGVGILYREGYFRQRIDERGRHEVEYPRLDFRQMPLEPAKEPSGRDLVVAVEMPKRKVFARIWKLQVGRTPLLLLDTDIRENRLADRSITAQLYGGSRENRIRQEVLLGIGGVRALHALGIEPLVWHMNEGHVAFLTLERLALARRQGLEFGEAVEAVAANTVFTTHTPVAAGNEVFDLPLAWRYLKEHAANAEIRLEDYLALGRDGSETGTPALSMTVLALRLSRYRNGVSALHGAVARGMWHALWPGFREEEVPIASITNGIHTQTWVAPEMDALYGKYLLGDWRARLHDAKYWEKVSAIPSREIWSAKQAMKRRLVDFVRDREARRLARLGVSTNRIQKFMEGYLDPGALTIGFARRFAGYKRADLLFHDLRRAARILGNTKQPVQILFAGKAHPQDLEGQRIFNRITAFARRPAFRGRVAVIEDYDMDVARHLVQGVDLWLNNPRRPLEASGTSGQKVPINGGLNASILDGWWEEGYAKKAGWSFGKTEPCSDSRRQDKEDAAALYAVLEREIFPMFFRRNSQGVPDGWMRMVKASMARHIPQFSTARMVREYAARFYLPAVKNGQRIAGAQGSGARELAAWRAQVERAWPMVHVRSKEMSKRGSLAVTLFLAGLSAGSMSCWDGEGRPCSMEWKGADEAGCYKFAVRVGRGKSAKGLRFFPTHRLLVQPQELGLALDLGKGAD